MIQQTEECFPRGGSKPSKTKKSVKRNENLFAISEKSQKQAKTKKNKRQKAKEKEIAKKSDEVYSIFVDVLSYNKIQEDMLILGCVHSITLLALQIELPGRTFGTVMVRSISNEFTSQLNKRVESNTISEETELVNLNKVFKLGQFVVVKVLSAAQTGKGSEVKLSMKPSNINSGKNHRSFREGMLIWASVVEKSDHCYILNAGVKNCRVILPFKKVDDHKQYDEGVPFWCVVLRCEILKEASTLTVSSLMKDINGQIEPAEASLDCIMPGSRLNFTYEKTIKGGLQGKILNDCISFVNETYFGSPFEKLSFAEGDSFEARVLYVQPTTKTTYLTSRSLETVAKPEIKNGDLLKATIEYKAGKGCVVKLNENEKGFVPYRRTIKSLPYDVKTDLRKLINKKFSIHSTHKCRVLDYNYLDNMYICTFEGAVVRDKVYHMYDLKAGQIVKGKVSEIKEAGIRVKIGNFHAFVNNLHLSNVRHSDNIKKKYSVGQQVTAKVLEIQPEQIRLTLKQALIESDECLSNYEQIEINSQFPGVVVQITRSGALLVFYNGVKGWLPRNDFVQKNIPNIKEIFYIGQVITVTLVKFDKSDTKLTLSVNPPKSPNKKLQIAQTVEGTVAEINSDGLILEIDGERALLPKSHLNEHASLADAFLAQYSVGDKILKLLCVSDGKTPIVSLREAKYYKNKRLPVLHNVRAGSFLRCYHKSTSSKGTLFYSAIKFLNKTIELYQKPYSDSDVSNNLKLLPNQFLVAKVLKVTKNCIRVTVHLSQVFDYNYEYSINILEQYICGVGELRQKLVERKDPITKLEIGSQVTCVVEQLGSKGGCSVVLNNNIRGIVDVHNCPKKIKKGARANGVVLWIDYNEKRAEVSLKPDHLGKINKTQDGAVRVPPHGHYFAETVLVREDFVEGVLDNKEGNKQLVFLPTVLHHNDFLGKHKLHGNRGHDKIKTHVCKTVQGRVIGMEKKIMRDSKKQQQFCRNKLEAIKKKRKLETKEESQTKRMKLEQNEAEDDVSNASESEDEGIDTRSDNESEKSINSDENDDEIQEESNSELKIDDVEEESNSEQEIDEVEEESKDVIGKGENSEESNDELIDEDDLNNSNGEIEEIDEDFPESDDDSLEYAEEAEENDSIHHKKNKIQTCETTYKIIEDEIESKQTKKRNKKETTESPNKKQKLDEEFGDDGVPKPLLPGIEGFFADDPKTSIKIESSDEEGDQREATQKKKKKLSAAERATEIRLEEERLRKIEKELADSRVAPQSADQFDRMLLGEPNNSELWTRYVAFHAEATEIEKARVVARKALNAISVTEIQDRLNVWIALLNLENLYGTSESYEKVFEEACRCNDSLTVYLESIRMLAELQKFKEMDEKIKKCRGKFKQIPQMWVEVGKIYYQIEQFEDARKLRASAVLTLSDKKTHVNVLVRFGMMEFNSGEHSQAESLFETILQNYPGRVDVWSTYVDQLIKIDKIELARKVLVRAAGQKLQFKKMQTLFKKYLWFEKRYGDDETVARVKQTISDFSKQIV